MLADHIVVEMAAARKQNISERMQTTLASLNTSRGVILPPLTSFNAFPRELVVAELQSQFVGATDRKLPLAYALAHHGDVRLDFLLSRVDGALANEAAMLAQRGMRSKPKGLTQRLLKSALTRRRAGNKNRSFSWAS